jgi:kumamolisin
MPFERRVALRGSDRKPIAGARTSGEVGKDESLQVTVVLNRPEAVGLVELFAREHGLTVADRRLGPRSILLSGSAEAMQTAFGTRLTYLEVPARGLRYRGRSGPVLIPEELADSVLAVLGLDDRPLAKPHFRKRAAAPSGAFTPPQVARLYDFPADVNGEGQTIAIIELGGGYRTADLQAYFSGLGIQMPEVSAVSVGGASNSPGDPADDEVMLDIEVAGAVAPGSRIVVYFAKNTDQGFHDAVAAASHDTQKPAAISISWGASEDDWTEQARAAMDAAFEDAADLDITVTAAAGDDGSNDGATDGKVHVDFPAASPYVLACGGTRLTASGNAISREEVWNALASGNGATGGGVSRVFPLPDYQSSARVPAHPETGFAGRGVPDIAGDADPATGYLVRVNGAQLVIGGTSAVSPLWAGLVALINQRLGRAVGFVNPLLYQNASALRDIVDGNNGAYAAGPRWDACTGWGSPNGAALANVLRTATT